MLFEKETDERKKILYKKKFTKLYRVKQIIGSIIFGFFLIYLGVNFLQLRVILTFIIIYYFFIKPLIIIKEHFFPYSHSDKRFYHDYYEMTKKSLYNSSQLGTLAKNNLKLENDIDYFLVASKKSMKIYNYVGVLVIDLEWEYLLNITIDDQEPIFTRVNSRIKTTNTTMRSNYIVLEIEVDNAIKTLVFEDFSSKADQELFYYYKGRY